MLNILAIILAAAIGYLCGSFSPGWVFLRLFKGIDLRTIGSGRTGGTNSMRAGGWKIGTLTGVSDVLKAAIAVWLTRLVVGAIGAPLADTGLPWLEIVAGAFAVVGHNWSIFLGFKGGAGTGPNVGWAAAIWWPMFPIALVVMPGMMVLTGMASLASMLMGLIIAVIFGILYALGEVSSIAYAVGGLVTFLIVVWALRPNIKRILNGTERLVGPRAKRKARQQEMQTGR
jgi:glycerol-3-phosphate acyltransferase PlsY